MDKHIENLQLCCRLGGERLSKTSRGTKNPVVNHAAVIKAVLSIDVLKDDPRIHPTAMCSKCDRAIHKAYDDDMFSSGGCSSLKSWSIHKRQECSFCSEMNKTSKGCRPQKKLVG